MSEERMAPTLELLKRIMALPGEAASPTQRLILTVYAYHANEDLVAWPSHALVAQEAGLARDTVWRNLEKLVGAGWLDAVGRTGNGVMRYQISLPGATESRTPCDAESHPPATQSRTNRSVEPIREPLSPDRSDGSDRLGGSGRGEREALTQTATTATKDTHPGLLRPAGYEAQGAAVPHRQEAAQLPLWGTATEHVEAVLAGLEERDREEVAAVLRAWLGQEGGARAVATWARQAAAWPPGRLASRGCPRAYVEACVARTARLVADESAREAAARAADEVRRREAQRDAAERAEAQARGAREEEALREAFRALPAAEQATVVEEALALVAAPVRQKVREIVREQDPLTSVFFRTALRGAMEGHRTTGLASAVRRTKDAKDGERVTA